mmetsp:Transcript_33096/g.105472  ORF Transcript_33096/g.105472 Transcript_33096/m.105472 type:complete len:272 (+) Transcript_33096:187-1002(+)
MGDGGLHEHFVALGLAAGGAAPLLLGLPDPLLTDILRRLSAGDLARASCASPRVRALAKAQGLWEGCCKHRWKGCEALAPVYDGDFHRMYSARAGMPAHLPGLADRSRGLREEFLAAAEGEEVPAAAASSFLSAAFSIGIGVRAAPALAGTPEARAHREDLRDVALSRPGVLARAAQEAEDLLNAFDFWTMDFSNWPDVPWRRTAIQWALEAARGEDQGVPNLLTEAVAALDANLLGAAQEAGGLAMPRPPEVPSSHWWYHMRNGGGFDPC